MHKCDHVFKSVLGVRDLNCAIQGCMVPYYICFLLILDFKLHLTSPHHVGEEIMTDFFFFFFGWTFPLSCSNIPFQINWELFNDSCKFSCFSEKCQLCLLPWHSEDLIMSTQPAVANQWYLRPTSLPEGRLYRCHWQCLSSETLSTLSLRSCLQESWASG